MINKLSAATLVLTLSLIVVSGHVGCLGGDGAGNNNYVPDPCTVDGECTAGENCINCAEDCCVQCSLQTITPAESRDYLITEIRWPETTSEAHEISMDLDGDGVPENKVGNVLALLATNGALINEFIAKRVARGELLLVLRVWADDLTNDGEALVQLMPAVPGDATVLFDGLDEVHIASASPTDRFACGTVESGRLVSDPAAEVQPLPSPMGRVVNDWMRYHRMRISGVLGEEQLTDVVVAGAIDEYDTQHVLIADTVAMLNEEIQRDPNHTLVEALASIFDGECSAGIPGCEDTNNGVGECDDTAFPPVITETEMHCNTFMNAIVSPDIDSDGDGEYDLLSGAWRISAVPVTIVP